MGRAAPEASGEEGSHSGLEQQVRSYLAENFFLGDGVTLTVSQSLLRSGVLDSTGVMELITWLEATFQIMIQDSEVVPANLDSIASIVAFVARKVVANDGRRGA